MECPQYTAGEAFKGMEAFNKAYPQLNPGTLLTENIPRPRPWVPYEIVPYKRCESWIPISKLSDPIFTTPVSNLKLSQFPKFLWSHTGITGFKRFYSWVVESSGTAHAYYRAGEKTPYFVALPRGSAPFLFILFGLMAVCHGMYYTIARAHSSHELHHQYPPERWARMSTLERHKARKGINRALAEKESSF